MSKNYELTATRRFVNRIMAQMIRWDVAPAGYYLLTVIGRKSGKSYTLPVTLIEDKDNRWLVSPYGEVSWVLNARAAGEVMLRRGGQEEMLTIDELGPDEAAPVLKRYVEKVSVVRPYFESGPDSPLEDFVAEASQHPVFRLGS